MTFRLLTFCFCFICITAQAQQLGGPCEGCEAISEFGNEVLQSTDTLPDYENSEPKLLIHGTVYQSDGKTPASGVIIYAYHTNREGIYPKRGDEKGWGKRHGYIRGWVKTGHDGQYAFYTFQPASYPNREAPAHIHLTVQEPGKTAYWIDDILFDDDPFVTQNIRREMRNRAGNGILELEKRDQFLVGNRDIILGLNIPNYR
ncbi:MAG TPA: intradiol ring-cleavage dioxygenase [Roseivirga sp.]